MNGEVSYDCLMGIVFAAASLLVASLLTGGCQAPAYLIEGAETRDAQPGVIGMEQEARVLRIARAGSQPVIRVEPANALGHRTRAVEVIFHGPDKEAGLYRIMGKLQGGHVSVIYAPPGGHQLPVSVGDSLRLRHIPRDPESAFRGDALIIRDAQDQVLVAYSAGGGLPSGVFDGRLAFSPSSRLAYTEVITLDSMCLAMMEHNRLRVQYDGTFHHIAPGTTVTLPFGDRTYRLVVIDVAEPVAGRCVGEAENEMSFALIAQL